MISFQLTALNRKIKGQNINEKVIFRPQVLILMPESTGLIQNLLLESLMFEVWQTSSEEELPQRDERPLRHTATSECKGPPHRRKTSLGEAMVAQPEVHGHSTKGHGLVLGLSRSG